MLQDVFLPEIRKLYMFDLLYFSKMELLLISLPMCDITSIINFLTGEFEKIVQFAGLSVYQISHLLIFMFGNI